MHFGNFTDIKVVSQEFWSFDIRTFRNHKARSLFPSGLLKVSQRLGKNQRYRSKACIQIGSQVFKA
jgi:hypothetical protein